MPFHIKKPVALGSGDVYYESGSTWTQTYADRKVYSRHQSHIYFPPAKFFYAKLDAV